jgi:Putative beta-barrel porin 2
MSGSRHSMLRTSSIRSRRHALRAAFGACFLVACTAAAFAQEPPLDVSRGSLPARSPDAVTLGRWLLYPTVRAYSLYSDNFFLSSQNPLSVLGFGLAPSLTAEWSNGIHTTTLYGNIDRQAFPKDNEVNTFDRQVGFTQKYEALRDLTFRVQGDYTHKTNATSLQNSIPGAVGAPATTVLPNGDILLPNGTILSPSGQPTGQTNPAIAPNGTFTVNPNNQVTGTFSVDKIFNRGLLSLSGSLARTDYETQASQDSRTRSLTENASVWLGPLLYAYSNGSIATFVPVASSGSTTSYRVVGGVGTRQFGLFRSSAYFGHQGSQGGSTAGGDVYGAALSFYPTPAWTLSATLDETINISSQASLTNLALTLPSQVPLQIPLSASTRVTASLLQSSYQISPQWFTSWQFGYTRIEYVGSPRLDNTLLVDATLRYDIWRNLSLLWEYRYTSILSNAPFVSAKSNFGAMSATYKF